MAKALDWLGAILPYHASGMNWLCQGSLFALICGMSGLASCPTARNDGRRTEMRWAADRARMVSEQLTACDRAITDPAVLQAMGKVPRHRFVPKEIMGLAYEDRPLPIGFGQTISQPYVVAFMTEQLTLKPADRVLEIGTGSGYQAAILAELAAEVYTIEIITPLAARAQATVMELGYRNIHVRAGDGYLGWPEAAPFDAIIVTCAPEKVPQPLVDQLKDGGRMIVPVGPIQDQELVLLRKQDGRIIRQAVLPVQFVPMTGRAENKSS